MPEFDSISEFATFVANLMSDAETVEGIRPQDELETIISSKNDPGSEDTESSSRSF